MIALKNGSTVLAADLAINSQGRDEGYVLAQPGTESQLVTWYVWRDPTDGPDYWASNGDYFPAAKRAAAQRSYDERRGLVTGDAPVA